MLRPLRLPAAVLAVLALAGCGDAADDRAQAPAERAAPAPKSAGPLTVAPVDGRLGDATTASDREALRELEVGTRKVPPGVLKQGVGAGAACPDQELVPAADNLGAVVAATLCMVNGERADAGLPPLARNERLDRSSAGHAEDMVRSSYFAHESQDGRDVVDRVRATGYLPADRQWTVGENLAWGTGTLATPRGIVAAWMQSEGHRENILRAGYREFGIGVALGNPRAGDGQGATYTMNFGAVSGGGQTLAANVSAGTTAPRTSAARKQSARRTAAKRKRSCRARARRARISAKRKRARIARCARAARRR